MDFATSMDDAWFAVSVRAGDLDVSSTGTAYNVAAMEKTTTGKFFERSECMGEKWAMLKVCLKINCEP